MATCRQCGKQLVGKEHLICKLCTEKDKDGLKRVGAMVGTVITIAGAAVAAISKLAALSKRSSD